MSWLFSQALVEASSAASCLDGEPSAPSNSNPIPQAYLSPDRMTAFSRLSRFGMTFAPLTDDRGEALLTWFLAGFPVRTYPLRDAGRESMESDQDFGWRWPESWAKYDPVSCSWRTRQSSLLGGSTAYSETWPRWGWMRNGELCPLPTVERPTYESASGLWQTLVADDAINREKGKINSRGEMKLSAQLIAAERGLLPTLIKRDARSAKGAMRAPNALGTEPLNVVLGGTPNPTWAEWFMGAPVGWTAFEPLGIHKFQSWRQQHGGF